LQLSRFLITIKNISEPFIRFKLMEMLEGSLKLDTKKEEFKKERDIMIDEQIKFLITLKTKDNDQN
jgi:hypothetical protein